MLLLLLLLRGPRHRSERRASSPPMPLLLAAVVLYVVPVSAGFPAASRCPLPIDCAKEGRHFCYPGSSHCGPCFPRLEENEEGRCVARKRHNSNGRGTLYTDLDAEIDYLHSVIEKQEVSEINSGPKQSKSQVDITSITQSKTGVSKPKQKSQDRSSSDSLRATTTVSQPEVSALPTPTPKARTTGVDGKAGPIGIPIPKNDRIIVILISLCVAVGTVAVIVATVCYVKLQRESRLAQKVDYPAFGGASAPAATTTGSSMGDKTLAQSAQMYHYQHQKQQMLSMGNHKPEQKVLDSEVTSDEEEVGGDFTVYECPGLAPTGEMEVKNPLFDDSTVHYQGNQK
ncbi:neural proliferation differentiation and control protein 1a isoform X2 [Anabas testudineus]|uniref:neural proliferation differentiation and control protein 1a isoform X2 n=1 Tax=Anabas testudineus TaxID=64144 RepID=UPI000E462CAD|nr:neural proliferation differentiation and control protein 1a isoform X2 [Anabas testudineus]